MSHLCCLLRGVQAVRRPAPILVAHHMSMDVFPTSRRVVVANHAGASHMCSIVMQIDRSLSEISAVSMQAGIRTNKAFGSPSADGPAQLEAGLGDAVVDRGADAAREQRGAQPRLVRPQAVVARPQLHVPARSGNIA
jgi:hypothetical protein